MVSHPRVFEIQTALLGGNRLAEAVQPAAIRVTQGLATGTVVDVGGGTASARSLWPESWNYVSIDPDERLVGLDDSGGRIQRMVGDASKLTFDDHSVDVVLMKNVSHHLDDATWSKALHEVRRILEPDGYFLFVDSLWNNRRLISRIGWALDAGRFPRSYEKIERAIASSFVVESVERLTLLHDSIIITSRPADRLEDSRRAS